MNLIEVSNNRFQFRFNAQSREEFDRILQRVKAISGVKYNPGMKLWESPVSSSAALEAAEIAQNYSFVITSECRDTMESITKDANILLNLALGKTVVDDNFGMKKQLRPYQKAAVQYGIIAGSHINGDSPGTGKTGCAIAIIDSQNLYPVLIITVKRAKIHWYREWLAWTDQRSVSIWSNESRGNSKVDIIHYDQADRFADYIVNYRKYAAVILDESHRVKSHTTKRHAAITKIVKDIPIRIGLTGTVIVNSMRDLAEQLRMIGRISIFGGIYKFLNEHTNAEQKWIYVRGGRKQKIFEFTGIRNEAKLYTILRSNCFIGRKKREIMADLPPITEEYIDTPANSESYRNEYNDTVNAMTAASEQLMNVRPGSMQEKSILDSAEKNLFALRRETGVAKLPGIKEFLFEFLDCGEKIVVFAHHIEVQEAIAGWFPGCAVLKGGQSEIEAQQHQDRFQNDPECKVIVCSMMAASEAITLTAASYLMITELPWTEKDLDQMRGRIDRLGQVNPMTIYYMTDQSENSVDSIMLKIIEQKKNLGKVNSTNFFIEQLTK